MIQFQKSQGVQKQNSKIFWHIWFAQLDKRQTRSKPVMVRRSVVSSIPTGGNFIFCWNFLHPTLMSIFYKNGKSVRFVKTSNYPHKDPSMSILCRNVRFVLFAKNLDWDRKFT